MKTVLKILSALVAIAGVVYVVAAYGDKIVAWARKFFPCHSEVILVDDDFEDDEPASVKTPEEAPAEEPAPAVDPADGQPVAEEGDFEG